MALFFSASEMLHPLNDSWQPTVAPIFSRRSFQLKCFPISFLSSSKKPMVPASFWSQLSPSTRLGYIEPIKSHFCSRASKRLFSQRDGSFHLIVKAKLKCQHQAPRLRWLLDWLLRRSEQSHPDSRFYNFGWIQMSVSSYRTNFLIVYRALINYLITPNRSGEVDMASIDIFRIRIWNVRCTAWTLGWDYGKISRTTILTMVD